MSLLLNALFHHSLMMIPQQEIPGTIPKAYVMKHPISGSVEVFFKKTESKLSLFEYNVNYDEKKPEIFSIGLVVTVSKS